MKRTVDSLRLYFTIIIILIIIIIGKYTSIDEVMVGAVKKK